MEIKRLPVGDPGLLMVGFRITDRPDCEADGGSCTRDGRALSPGLEVTVPGPE